ncbi:Seryl-tRNA synthetase [hydrothermal vent metagenome]|uniref:Serine--tRNA ligase n=1 Tax=hydrothermal vent metagenome TaxID=652676 RepID=A0A3B0SDL5_9ZZZZ
MIDITILRERPEELERSLARRGVEIDLDRLVALDQQRRAIRAQAEELRAKQKEIGKTISSLSGDDRQVAIDEAGEIAERYKVLVAEADALDEEFNARWIALPNMTDPTAAEGLEEEDAVEIKKVGVPPEFDFEVRDHVDLGVALGVIDIERAVKMSGSRFALKKGKLALLEMALMRWAVTKVSTYGFTPVIPPVLVREHALYGTGFFPGDREQVYSVREDDLYLVGTSEVPLAAMHGDEILDVDELPLRYVGMSTCFRVEAGTYGKDTRGMFRVHQFDKAEMFSFVHPDRSRDEHDYLLEREEEIVRALDIPYRVVNVAAGDLGSSAAKKYDIEAWFPGQGRYREITSTSNTTDFQARRLKIRVKADGRNQFVHTLNGTVVTPRHLIALMENHQDADGSIHIPDVLVPFTGFDVIEAG